MNAAIRICLGLYAAIFLGTVGAADGGDPSDQDVREWLKGAKVSVADAIAKGLAAKPGQAVEVELDSEMIKGERKTLFEVKVIAEKGMFEVLVDAGNGKVIAIEEAVDADEVDEERAYRSVLRHCELDLAALVAKGGDFLKGTPVAANLEMDDGQPCCELVFVNGRHLIEVVVEARAGHLVEIEVVSNGKDEEKEDGENEDEDDDEDETAEAEGSSRKGLVAERSSFKVPSPLKDGVTFDSKITHTYFPLSELTVTTLESEDERVVRQVQKKTTTVGGIACTTLDEIEYEDGKLVEISYNYFAQDADGNVWYFGEDVDDYEDGEVVGHGGAWKVGVNAAEPCLFMPAKLEQGMRFKRENSPPAAEEFNEIVGIQKELKIGGRTFHDVLAIRESDDLRRWVETKYYVAGMGLISENRELNLVETDGESKDK